MDIPFPSLKLFAGIALRTPAGSAALEKVRSELPSEITEWLIHPNNCTINTVTGYNHEVCFWLERKKDKLAAATLCILNNVHKYLPCILRETDTNIAESRIMLIHTAFPMMDLRTIDILIDFFNSNRISTGNMFTFLGGVIKLKNVAMFAHVIERVEFDYMSTATNQKLMEIIAMHGDMLTLHYMREKGAPWPHGFIKLSVIHGNTECLRYAYENNCPIPVGFIQLCISSALLYRAYNSVLCIEELCPGSLINSIHMPRYIRRIIKDWYPPLIYYMLMNSDICSYVFELPAIRNYLIDMAIRKKEYNILRTCLLKCGNIFRALHTAMCTENLSMVEFLFLDFKIDGTPAMYTPFIKKGNLKMVELLAKYGTPITQNVLEYAISCEQTEIVNALKHIGFS